MNELALLLLVAAAGHAVSRWTGLPVIPLLLGLGMTLSFTGLVAHPSLDGVGLQDEPLFMVLELGLTFLVFASGLELDPRRFRGQTRAVAWVGMTQFLAMGVLGFGAAKVLGFGNEASLYVGCAVSASSTLVVLRQLRMAQKSFEPFGRLVLGVLLLQDVLIIAGLVVLARFPEGGGAIASGLGWAALLAGVAWVLQQRGPGWILRNSREDDETWLLGVLSLLFVFVGAAYWTGLPLVAGAFLAGCSLSRFPLAGLVEGLVQSLTDFFRAVFFVALGALVVIPEPATLVSAGVLTLLVLVVTPPLVALVAERNGFSLRPALESGLLLAQTSEYSLILGLIGLRQGQLDGHGFATIALMTAVTMTVTPFLARDRVTSMLMHFSPWRRRREVWETELRDHVLILGFGAAGMWVLRPLLKEGHKVLVVDDDPVVIADLEKRGIACLRGDGADEQTLARAGVPHAKLILSAMRRVGDARQVLASAKGVPVVVRVLEDHEEEMVKKMGGIPLSNAEASVEPFLRWVQERFGEEKDGTGAVTGKAGSPG